MKERRMKKYRLFAILCVALLAFVGCKKDDPATEKDDETFFYVKYTGHCSAVWVSKQATMIITNKEGKEERYHIGDREITIGPVYAVFDAKLHIINPDGEMISCRIDVSRNSDSNFIDMMHTSGDGPEFLLFCRIQPNTGL